LTENQTYLEGILTLGEEATWISRRMMMGSVDAGEESRPCRYNDLSREYGEGERDQRNHVFCHRVEEYHHVDDCEAAEGCEISCALWVVVHGLSHTMGTVDDGEEEEMGYAFGEVHSA